MTDPERLINDHLDDSLDATGHAELHAWLMEDAAHMRRFTKALMFDEEMRRAVHAKEAVDWADRFAASEAPLPSPTPSGTLTFKPVPKASHRLARAAAWLGAFTWFGNKAQATTTATLFMTKTAATTTTITVTILLLGGGSLHLLHNDNQQAAARVARLQEHKDSVLSTKQLRERSKTISGSASLSSAPHTPIETDTAEVSAYLKLLSERIQTRRVGMVTMTSIDTELVNQMDRMDLETLRQLLIEARQNDFSMLILSTILDKIAAKSPADATALAADIVTKATPFDEMLSSGLGNYFRNWMHADQAAAEQWYAAAMASGELIPMSIPQAGRENSMPDRIIMQNRFKALLDAGSEQAISMVGGLSNTEVAYAMSSLAEDYTNAHNAPGFISRIVSRLPPQQQNDALRGYVDFMAAQDFPTASAWLDAVDIAEWTQASLLSRAARIAYDNKHLTQSEAMKIIEGLPDSAERQNALYWIEMK